MPDWMLPVTFLSLRAEFQPVFTAPSFENFRVLVCGFVHALGKHRTSDALRAAGSLASKHYSTYYGFFPHASWSLDEFGLVLLSLVIGVLGLGEVELILDDTLARRSGKKVALAGMHADPLLRNPGGRPFCSLGHVFVVLAVHIRVPLLGRTGWALPASLTGCGPAAHRPWGLGCMKGRSVGGKRTPRRTSAELITAGERRSTSASEGD